MSCSRSHSVPYGNRPEDMMHFISFVTGCVSHSVFSARSYLSDVRCSTEEKSGDSYI